MKPYIFFVVATLFQHFPNYLHVHLHPVVVKKLSSVQYDSLVLEDRSLGYSKSRQS